MKMPPRILLPMPRGKPRPLQTGVSALVWIFMAGAMLLCAFMKESLLPRYFFFDAGTINKFISMGAKLVPGDSYSSTAAVFGMLGFRQSSPLLPICTGMVVVPSLLWGIWSARGRFIRISELTIFGFFSFMGVIYLTTLSKDVIVLLLILSFVFLVNRGRGLGLISWVCLALLYGYFFRTYWFIVVLQFIAFRAALPRLKNRALIVMVVLMSLFSIAVIIRVKFGLSADAFRTSVNEARVDAGVGEARTMIAPVFQGAGFLLGYINVCLTLAELITPVPLLAVPSPYYILIFIFIATLQYAFWKSTWHAILSRDRFSIDCATLVISFLLVQSLFEPDYGSYVRHLAPFYPLMFYVWLRRPFSAVCDEIYSKGDGIRRGGFKNFDVKTI
ncbi:hypothetical protein [Paraburkholderia phytofirmans]|nr:hypothetical protein [Paraburkholderia phytofirmans]